MQLMSGIPWETVTLTTLSRDRALFPYLLREARDLAMQGQEGKLVIHTAWGIEWRPFGQPRQKRPLHSVVLGSNIAENIEKDVKAFLNRRQWYSDRGLPILYCFDTCTCTNCAFLLQAFRIVEGIYYMDPPGLGRHRLSRRLQERSLMTFVFLTSQSEDSLMTNYFISYLMSRSGALYSSKILTLLSINVSRLLKMGMSILPSCSRIWPLISHLVTSLP